ncbi:receptor-like protein EIX1 [Dioscorea cayenensis subsp. rotundata]|uniref:Receptor-like protein EIX1 n=1 Tax=Dioscorea cayennensis subsp. rotundata TaxID=55577 RepID=A0AB40C9Z6_DIOCR|nr:receptor-like protein EIX1 [Dioscorea cayenensis subsp. rotundata]
MACLSLFVFLAILVVSVFPPCYVHGIISCIETERITLLSIKAGINQSDDQSLFSSWTGHDCCKWQGVSCNHESRHVIKLDLRQHPSNYISDYYDLPPSKLNSSLIQLHHLKHLDLSMNNFDDSHIPDFIGSFANLEYLNLSHAGFSGAIPHTFGNLSCLRYLDLSSNYNLQPNDLHWLSGMTSLHHLDLSGGNLSKVHGWLLDINSVLPSLRVLKLSNAILQGGGIYATTNLPHYLNFTSLRVLDLSYNSDLNITLPQWLFNLTNLIHLDLFGCALYGKLPVTVGHLSYLRVFSLSDNSFGGVIPESFGNLGSLEKLDLSWNKFIGGIPDSLSNLTNLVYFDLSNNMIGKLSESIGRLQKLVEFHLSNNQIQGLMPASIGALRNLQYLDLSQNMISGAIPESFGNLTLLQHFDGAVNNLRGKLPETMGNFIHLQFLYLSQNMIAGELPGSMGKLTSLTVLDLSMNNISGILPKSIKNLCKLRELRLSSNLIKGAIDDLVNGLSNCPENYIRNSSVSEDKDGMRYLNLANNRFNGRVPESIGRLANLRILQLKENSFVGTLTEHHFLNLTDLYYMDFSYNLLQLNVPNDWVPPFHALTIMMCSCRISSVFPAWLKTQTGLEYLCLSEAEISGNVPTWFWNLSSNGLVLLNISHNNLSGILPTLQHSSLEIIDMSHNKFEAIVSATNLRSLHLQKNSLSGNLPLPLKNAKKLVVLDIGENRLSGTIPSWIGSLVSLVFLRLRSNLFEGSIPEQLLNLSSLQVLDLAQNNLSGVIFLHTFGGFKAMAKSPSGRSQLLIFKYDLSSFSRHGSTYKHLESLVISAKGQQREYTKVLLLVTNIDLSCNRLSGKFPDELTSLHGLIFLNLSNNLFNGKLPENIGDMNQLQSLDLSSNNFSGIIPPSISALYFLSQLNLSHNKLSGEIPSGNQLRTLDASGFFYNDGLCGYPLSNCINVTPSQGSFHGGNQDERGDWFDDLWLYIGLASGFIVGFWMFILFIMIKKSRRISYFRSVDKVYDWIYVRLVVYSRRLKSILTRKN